MERAHMIDDLLAASIMLFHDRKMAEPVWPDPDSTDSDRYEGVADAWRRIEANHRFNTLLWNEEDKARRTDVDASEIANSKRLIDRYNQKRNDAVEAIDEAILSGLDAGRRQPDARLNSETAGAMIDRLSILCLKIYHMRQQTQRQDVDRKHILDCEAKLARLIEQRQDLGACLDRLLAEARSGSAYFKLYRQFKMYNDPALNPYLYGAQRTAGGRRAAL